MTDRRPSGGARSELRRTIQPWDFDIPLISADPFTLDADLIINGEEYVRCTSRSEHWLLGCQRGLHPEEGGVTARTWLGGTPVDQVPWTTTEITTEYPTVVTDAMVGRDFAWDAGDGNVYRYHVVRIEGTPVVIWDDEPPPEPSSIEFQWASAITGLTSISGVAIDPSGNIYTNNGVTLKKYSPALALQWSVAPGVLAIWHSATDGTNVISTAQLSGPSYALMQRLASTGGAGSPGAWGGNGSGNGVFNAPLGIVFDGTSVWVVDTGNNRVQKFTASTGTYVSQFGGFTAPTGISLAAGKLYVLNAGAGEVRRYDATTHALETTLTLGIGTADGQISTTAEGIAVDSQGRLWVADTGNHRIQVFDDTGNFLAKFGSFGSGDGELKSPKQIAFNPAGTRAHIADSGNGRLVTLTAVDSAQLALGYYAYTWDEEFIGGGTASGAIGERGWTFNGSGSVTVLSSLTTNPGLISVTSGASSGNSSRITLGPWLLPQIDKMTFIGFFAQNGTTGNARIGMGMGSALSSAPTDGVTVEYDTSIGTNIQFVKWVGGVATRVDSGIPFVANRQYLLEITKLSTTSVQMRLIDLVTMQEATSIITGVSATAQLDATFFSKTTSNANKNVVPDYWSGSFSGLSRA